MHARLCLTTLVSAAICLPLTACERGSGSQAGGTTVTIWAHHGQPDENAAMKRIVDDFNAAHEAQHVRIDITFFPDRQYADKVSIAAVSGSLPDVLDIDGPYVGPWAADGLLSPIDDLVSTELRDDMLRSLIEQGTYEGKLYALGAFDSALVVYYNRDMLEKADLHPPETIDDAWTWGQFIGALQAVQPYCTLPLSLHMNDASDEWFTYAFSPLIWSNGGKLIDTWDKQVVGVLNGQESVRAIEQWQQLFNRGFAEPTSTREDPFSHQLVAFDWNGHWMLPTYEHTDGLRFGAMPLPKLRTFVAPSGSWCWGLSSSCRDRKAAWMVVSWFLEPEHGIKPVVEANGAVPGRKSAFALFPEYDKMPRRLFKEQLLNAAHPRPRTAVYLDLTSEFARALRDIANSANVRQRLTSAAEAVQRALDRK